MNYRKKLIEVALPLDAINKASAREKSIRHGHPSTLHLWWARRPLAAARAVIFAQMVDDPSSYVDELRNDPDLVKQAEKILQERSEGRKSTKNVNQSLDMTFQGKTEPETKLDEILAELERERLFRIIEDLVLWENTTNETVLQQARDEIWKSWRRTCSDNADHPQAKELFDPNKLPAFHDPFAGGGSLPLEAQRLGLESYASDLNPVAVLINKAMIEIPPKFAGLPPINPEARKDITLFKKTWKGAEGLAEDVRYYGNWMRDEAEKRIGHLYPKVGVTPEMAKDRPDLKPYVGKSLTVIAWIWARTVKSPNPAFANVDVPLVSTFMLSTKKGKEAFVEPVIDKKGYRFLIKTGQPKNVEAIKRGTKSGGSGSQFLCLMSGTPMTFEYLRSEAKAGRMGVRLMATIAEGECGRVFISPTTEMETLAQVELPRDVLETELPEKALGFRVQEYGITRWCDLFTSRQIVALKTFCDLIQNVREQVKQNAFIDEMLSDCKSLKIGEMSATAYSEAISLYLAFAVDRAADYWSSLAIWSGEFVAHTFGRQALPMTWDFAECNPFSRSTGCWSGAIEWISRVLEKLQGGPPSVAVQADATKQKISQGKIVSTDPPYYDNIGYADLSDFFYVWLRQSIYELFPDLFSTIGVPKVEELIASPYRHGSKKLAEKFFLDGMTHVMQQLAEQSHPHFPVTIYYAFKQSDTTIDEGTSSTGWATFLDAIISAGFSITGTWPIRTERQGRILGNNTNALASSIVIVCRQRSERAPVVTRREFISGIKTELPLALAQIKRGNIAPVDLAQASIGPGMAVFTRYEKVLDSDGHSLTVREALSLINHVLDEILTEQEGDFDAETRWALAWFEQCGLEDGEYGTAETLSKAKNTSIESMRETGILYSKTGKVRLLKPEELPQNWDPTKDQKGIVWKAVHQLIHALNHGENAAAEIVAKLGSQANNVRDLAYRLYSICERRKQANEALAYNALVQSWPEIIRLAEGIKKTLQDQEIHDQELF